MKFNYFIASVCLSLFFVSCNADSENVDSNNLDVNELEEMNELMEGLNEPNEFDADDWRNFFSMAVPEPMQELDELNPSAIAQYAYVEEVPIDSLSSEVKEHYLIVLMELKSEIEGYPTEKKIDAMSYRNDAVSALLSNGNGFKNITAEPKVEKLHGLDCVRNELSRTIDAKGVEVLLYYQMAIIEGEKAFYQLLTWCVDSQRGDFEYEMEKIINSFKEK